MSVPFWLRSPSARAAIALRVEQGRGTPEDAKALLHELGRVADQVVSIESTIEAQIAEIEAGRKREECFVNDGQALMAEVSRWLSVEEMSKKLIDGGLDEVTRAAPNFAERTVEVDGQEYFVTFIKASGKSPGTLVVELKAELAALRGEK